MTKTNYVVLTGAMGGGKSTLLRELSNAGICCVAELAREILAEQRAIEADRVSEQNAERFCTRMLARSLQNYEQAMTTSEVQVFDRGIPDTIAYAELGSLESTPFWTAADRYRYNPRVFFFEGWEAIYTTDAERTMDFDDARRFGARVRVIYQELGYHLVNVPFQSIEERKHFILDGVGDVKQ